MKILISLLFLSLAPLALSAQNNRIVDLSWTASTSANVTGYNLMRAIGAGTPVQINTTLVLGTTFSDSTVVVGNTYTYTAIAVAPACTPTTPVTTACGQSAPSIAATTTIPPAPAAVVSFTVTVR